MPWQVDRERLMHGPQFAKKYVNDYLKQDVPLRLIEYRNGWQLSEAQLPSPADYFTYEPIALDSWPTIITVAISTNSFTRIGFDRGEPLYRVAYTMRTYVWARADGSEHATDMRDRLTVVVRSALLDRPCLEATDPRGTFKASIEETTMREEFSDLTLLKGDRVLAGSYVAYELQIDEIVARASIGQVSEVEVDVKGVGMSVEALPNS